MRPIRCLAILGLIASATSAFADQPPAPFVYVQGNALWILRPGDAAPRRIPSSTRPEAATRPAAADWTSPSSPVFVDPVGRRVLFAAYRLERFGQNRRGINLEVADLFRADDTGVMMVTDGADLSIATDVSANGEDVYFTSNQHARLRGLFPKSNNMEVFAIKPPWRLPERITRDGGSKFNPRISPDGFRLAYLWLRSDGPSGLYVLRIGEDAPRMIAPAGDYPTWRPDGEMIAFANRGRLYEVKADGDTTARPLLPASFQGYVSFPRWTDHGLLFQWSDGEQEGISLLKSSGAVQLLRGGEARYGGGDLARTGEF
jgi:hypothetical protein